MKFADYVKVEYPLKQGLKPMFFNQHNLQSVQVKVEYPLKQGLKLPVIDFIGCNVLSS